MKFISTFLLTLILLASCFGGVKHSILNYKLNQTTDIEVYSMGYGATTKDYTDIKKIGPDENVIIKRIDGSYPKETNPNASTKTRTRAPTKTT
jgi:hypothetical protein